MKTKVTRFTSKVDCNIWREGNYWKASICIGEEYFESDPYKDRECALAEIKGWWEGIKIQVDSFLNTNCNE